MTSFTKHHLRTLHLPSLPTTQQREENLPLRALVLREHIDINDTLPLLESLELNGASRLTPDPERDVLVNVIVAKLAVQLYSEMLDIFLREARDAETEAEWWSNIERSKANVAWFLLQTLPIRFYRGFKSISQGIPRPGHLASALFPHLHRQDHLLVLPLTFANVLPSVRSLALFPTSNATVQSSAATIVASLRHSLNFVLAALTLPFELTQQECRLKRRRLQLIRDNRASALGALAQQRHNLQTAISTTNDVRTRLPECVISLQRVAGLGHDVNYSGNDTESPVTILRTSFQTLLPDHERAHKSALTPLTRPGRLTRVWPKIVFLPPLVLLAVRALYNRKSSLMELYQEAKDTIRGFIRGWVLEPLADVLHTVRAGGDDEGTGVIIKREGVKADMDSLERMAVSLAQDKLAYTPAQVADLRIRIAAGDLTPVLEIYEADIRTPMRSALTGTLLRSVFIQVQKAKVDIDQALTGIDKLIKSQELTFAFVGVAPALAIAYVIGGYLRRLLSGTAARLGLPGAHRHEDRYGGSAERARVAAIMRRVERLLVWQPAGEPDSQREANGISFAEVPPLTHGLLLVSLAHLRSYAIQCLPARRGFLRDSGLEDSPDLTQSPKGGVALTEVAHTEKGIYDDINAAGQGGHESGGDPGMQESFLEDIGDLEDPHLGREDRLRVVDRMWRCWGVSLGWGMGGA